VARIFDPILQFLRNLPALALYPLFILLFGLGELSKVAIIMKGTMWPILMNTTEGAKATDPLHIKAARSMGIGHLQLFTKVIFPAAFPFILTGLRLGATRSILLLVGAEMMGADEGLGFLIFDMQHKYEIPEMYAAIIIMVIVGLATNALLVALEKKATKWKESTNPQS
jgi:NitT/TauT family transport system permease protein